MIRFLMSLFGIQTAVGALIVRDGKILLTKRSSLLIERNKWCLPGGHVEKWETIENAVKRELLEETGLRAKNIKLLFMHEEFVKRLGLHAHVFVFLVDVFGKVKTNWEVSKYGWFSRKEIERLPLAFSHKEILERFWRLYES